MKRSILSVALFALTLLAQQLHADRIEERQEGRRAEPKSYLRTADPSNFGNNRLKKPSHYSPKPKSNQVRQEVDLTKESSSQAPPPNKPNAQLQHFFQQEQQKAKSGHLQTQERNQEFKKQYAFRQKQNNQKAEQLQKLIKQNHEGMDHWFGANFNQEHRYTPYYDSGKNWWRASPWRELAAWVGWELSIAPLYYEDGHAQSLPDDFYLQSAIPSSALAQPVPPHASQEHWLPLGIFAVGTSENQMESTPSFYQLALNREGEIAGTYYNASTNQVHPIEGMVDKSSQQVAWRVADNAYAPIITTGLYNLSQDAVPLTIFFSPDSPQQWWMIRVQQ